MGTLRIKEYDAEDGTPGRTLELTNVEFTPLGYADLKNASLTRPITISLRGCGRGPITADGVAATTAAEQHFCTSLESHFASETIGACKRRVAAMLSCNQE